MRKTRMVRALIIFVLLLTTAACGEQGQQGPNEPDPLHMEDSEAAASAGVTVTETTRAAPTSEPTAEEPTATATSIPQSTATESRPSAARADPRPTATPIPTPRPLAEGECIAWYETPSFLGQEVCVEGKVNFTRSANPARSRFFVVVDPSVPDIDHCCGLFYGWMYVDSLFDPIPEGGVSGMLEGKCVRLHGTVEKSEGRYRISVKVPEQFEVIECSECQVRDACVF